MAAKRASDEELPQRGERNKEGGQQVFFVLCVYVAFLAMPSGIMGLRIERAIFLIFGEPAAAHGAVVPFI